MGLHRDETDAGLVGGVHRTVEFVVAVLAEVVLEHDGVNPRQGGRFFEQFGDVAVVTGKTKEANLAFLLPLLGPFRNFRVEHRFVLNLMEEEQIHVIGLHPLE